MASGQAASEQQRVASAVISGRAHVIDGDTIKVAGERVRLIGIDRPEGRQTCTAAGRQWSCGSDASTAVRLMIDGRRVSCEVYGRDRYRRPLAEWFADGFSISATIVRTGWALAWNPSRGAARGLNMMMQTQKRLRPVS